MARNEITMPKLSDTMEEGKIIRWLAGPTAMVRPPRLAAKRFLENPATLLVQI